MFQLATLPGPSSTKSTLRSGGVADYVQGGCEQMGQGPIWATFQCELPLCKRLEDEGMQGVEC
jgi:hypothetical protein